MTAHMILGHGIDDQFTVPVTGRNLESLQAHCRAESARFTRCDEDLHRLWPGLFDDWSRPRLDWPDVFCTDAEVATWPKPHDAIGEAVREMVDVSQCGHDAAVLHALGGSR